MLVDYHTHHDRCGHAVGGLEEYIQAAVKRGLGEIGFSDHQPVIHLTPEQLLPEVAMTREQLPEYVEEALRLQEQYKDEIVVRVGLEADWIEGYREPIRELLATYPFDYVIGSVHFLGEWDITDYRQLEGWDSRDHAEVCREYFRQIRLSAESGLFDTLGHIDVVKRFGHIPAKLYEYLLEETIAAIREAGVCVEVNTSGLRYKCEEQFPSRRLLEMMYSHGVPLTVGSDAHKPELVGEGLETVVPLIKSVGYREVHGFVGRQRYAIEL
ncbi:MAG TPA: histidinol-phosphatase HisJ family protein [Bacilli bacterium]|nr:histidinol-phosphatase HisJ family protein [Bacilli bacterium]